MVLGTLSLFHKSGIFYKDVVFHSEDKFSETIQKELTIATGLQRGDQVSKHQITPVDEDGDTDYIQVFYTDAGAAEYPYGVTVWVLIEEVPVATHKE